jgi:hypothetical protein
MDYKIIKGHKSPAARPAHRKVLNELVALASRMEVGDAVALKLSDAQLLRIILAAQGFDCVTDGWHCEENGKTLVFKLASSAAAAPGITRHDVNQALTELSGAMQEAMEWL